MAFDLEPDASGLYGLCLYNADTLEDDEIQETFGKFGPVVNINRSKKLVFVRYQEREEAESCLVALRNHPKIKVNPAKRKNQGSNDQRNQRSFERSPRDDMMNNSRDSSTTKPRHSSEFSERQQSLPPKLIPINNDDENENVPPKALAKAVVINNIASGTQQCQIYQACTSAAKTPPLAVEMKSFKRPGYRTINYALVFLKTSEEAQQVVDGLNNLDLNGRTLIVKTLEHYQNNKSIRLTLE